MIVERLVAAQAAGSGDTSFRRWAHLRPPWSSLKTTAATFVWILLNGRSQEEPRKSPGARTHGTPPITPATKPTITCCSGGCGL